MAVSGAEAGAAGGVAVTAGEAAAVALGGAEAVGVAGAAVAVGAVYEAGKEAVTKAEEAYEDLETFLSTYHRLNIEKKCGGTLKR